jgi:hypothetical protein
MTRHTISAMHIAKKQSARHHMGGGDELIICIDANI